MLLVACSPSRVWVAVVCLLEPFIDERFVLGLPLVFVLRQVFLNRYNDAIDRQSMRQSLRDAGLIAAFTAPYILLRLIELRRGDTTSGNYFDIRMHELQGLSAPFYVLLNGPWMGLRSGWLLVVALVGLLYVRRPRKPAAVAALAVSLVIVLTIAMALVIAADTGRSASMIWPAAVVGLLLMMRARPRWVQRALPALLAANLILPASSVVMATSTPVLYFYVQLRAYQGSRGLFRAGSWLDSAKALLQQKKFPEALHQLDIAVQLDGHLVEGFVYRAIANIQLGKIDAAARDADTAIALDPKSADAMFVRGTIYDSQHDTITARRFFEQALNASSPDWHFRTDCITALKATQQ
jgi:tetratricopeptide (TPR) repeat protein